MSSSHRLFPLWSWICSSYLCCMVMMAMMTSLVSAEIENWANGTFVDNCSAANAYVYITEPESLRTSFGTLLSAQALFPPFTYAIEEVQLIALSSAESLCAPSSVSTNLTNRAVLVWSQSHLQSNNCSNHFQVYIAETLGADAVLIANSVDGDLIYNIISDEPSINDGVNNGGEDVPSTSIPARLISENTGIALAQALLTAANANTKVFIEISCDLYNLEYPSVICVQDGDGSHFYLDGEYQKQAMRYVNDHPLYIKAGYTGYTADAWLYLENMDGDQDLRWVIAYYGGTQIEATCSYSTAHPAQCVQWLSSNSSLLYYWINGGHSFELDAKFRVNDSLCEMSDDFVCIATASDNTIAGLKGTYRQISSGATFWFREFDIYNAVPGYLTFEVHGRVPRVDDDNNNNNNPPRRLQGGGGGGGGGGPRPPPPPPEGYFMLYDPIDYVPEQQNYELIAYCSIGDTYTTEETFQPWLCSTWAVRSDMSMDLRDFEYDLQLAITQSECGTVYTTEAIGNTDALCLSENSVMHAFVEGEYEVVSAITPSGRPVYANGANADLLANGYSKIYLWWMGDLYDKYPWWILSDTDFYTANLTGDFATYGYCPSSGMNPVQCHACWYFFWAASSYDYGAFHTDCQFQVAYDACPIETTAIAVVDEDDTFPDYICVLLSGDYVFSFQTIYDEDFLEGAYAKSADAYDGYPYWYKNDDKWGDIYIYYDAFYSHWNIARNLGTFGYFICLDTADSDPTQCLYWYDYLNERAQDFSIASCTAQEYQDIKEEYDPISVSGTDYNSGGSGSNSQQSKGNKLKSGGIIGIVVGVLLAVLCLLVALLYCKRRGRSRMNQDFAHAVGLGSRSRQGNDSHGHGSSRNTDGEAHRATPAKKTGGGGISMQAMKNQSTHRRIESISFSQELGTDVNRHFRSSSISSTNGGDADNEAGVHMPETIEEDVMLGEMDIRDNNDTLR